MMGAIRMRRLVLALLAPFLLAACAAAPDAVHWGVEECAHCQMVISDERYAGQVVDRRGMTYKFDAIECMAAFLRAGTVTVADVHSVWIAEGRDGWIPADDARFVHSDEIRSPMGGGLAAFGSREDAERLHSEIGGAILVWNDVLRLEQPAHRHGNSRDSGADTLHADHDAH